MVLVSVIACGEAYLATCTRVCHVMLGVLEVVLDLQTLTV